MLLELLMALLVAALASAVLVAAVGWDGYAAGGWPTAAVVFGLFFLVVWAGGVWLTPLGPEAFGSAARWIPFIVVGFGGALLWAAVSPWRRPRTMHAGDEQAQAKEVVSTTMVVIAAVVAFVVISALALHYVAMGMPPGW